MKKEQIHHIFRLSGIVKKVYNDYQDILVESSQHEQLFISCVLGKKLKLNHVKLHYGDKVVVYYDMKTQKGEIKERVGKDFFTREFKNNI